MMNQRKKVIVDTDIGGDVDDALALGLVLKSEEFDLIGVTTVYIDNIWRGGVTRNLLQIFGRSEIPVVAGAEKPLIGWWDSTKIPSSAENCVEFSNTLQESAAEYIVRMARQQDNLTIIAIGPLTNVALAIAIAPDIISRIKVVLMGGVIGRTEPEWNILCDPEAARIVFESSIPIKMIGLDVTEQCRFDRDDIEEIRGTKKPETTLLAEMMDTFVEKFGYLPILHDPLAVAALLWDDLLVFEKKRIMVETKGDYSRGVTAIIKDSSVGEVWVAVSVRAEEFKKRLKQRLKQEY